MFKVQNLLYLLIWIFNIFTFILAKRIDDIYINDKKKLLVSENKLIPFELIDKIDYSNKIIFRHKIAKTLVFCYIILHFVF